jgi:microcystin-dependent protein
MGSPYIGEIRMFGGSFAPAGWAFCSGETVAISQNDALFNLIGTTYGGDGQETFNLPDLRGRIPIHAGTGPGLSTRIIGEAAGVESVTLTSQQIPSHSHPLLGSTANGTSTSPSGALPASPTALDLYRPATTPASPLAPQAVVPAGGSQPHDNMAPYLVITFIISLYGIYPSQT